MTEAFAEAAWVLLRAAPADFAGAGEADLRAPAAFESVFFAAAAGRAATRSLEALGAAAAFFGFSGLDPVVLLDFALPAATLSTDLAGAAVLLLTEDLAATWATGGEAGFEGFRFGGDWSS